MNEWEQLDKAFAFAKKKHDGQKRRGGADYFEHPRRVSSELMNKSEILAIAGVLHDTVEDTDTSLEEIYNEFGFEVENIVASVTKNSNESYDEFIDRVCLNKDAVIVKIADIIDNLTDQPSEKQIDKYLPALKKLLLCQLNSKN